MLTGLISLLLVAFVQASNEILPPHGKVCYYENLKPGDKFRVNFQVGTRDAESSEQLDVDFYINDPLKSRVFNLNHVTDGHIPDLDISAPGKYEYCFSNERSGIKTKDVTFHVEHVWGSELRTEQYDTLDGQLKLLKRIVDDLSHESEYLRIRERTHRNTAESTNTRVKWWSVAQLIFVAANAFFQVAYLKRFFEVRSDI